MVIKYKNRPVFEVCDIQLKRKNRPRVGGLM